MLELNRERLWIDHAHAIYLRQPVAPVGRFGRKDVDGVLDIVGGDRASIHGRNVMELQVIAQLEGECRTVHNFRDGCAGIALDVAEVDLDARHAFHIRELARRELQQTAVMESGRDLGEERQLPFRIEAGGVAGREPDEGPAESAACLRGRDGGCCLATRLLVIAAAAYDSGRGQPRRGYGRCLKQAAAAQASAPKPAPVVAVRCHCRLLYNGRLTGPPGLWLTRIIRRDFTNYNSAREV